MVKEGAGVGLRPVVQHLLQVSARDGLDDIFLHRPADAAARPHGGQRQVGRVADQRPPDLQAQRAALVRFVNEVATGEPSTFRAWNAGASCCGGATTDDVTYLRRVVAAVAARVPVDRHRVYVVGLSNGGMMATRAVCDAPQDFAAAGTVAITISHAIRSSSDSARRVWSVRTKP